MMLLWAESVDCGGGDGCFCELLTSLRDFVEVGAAATASVFLTIVRMGFFGGPETRAAAAMNLSIASLESTSRVAFGGSAGLPSPLLVQPRESLSATSQGLLGLIGF